MTFGGRGRLKVWILLDPLVNCELLIIGTLASRYTTLLRRGLPFRKKIVKAGVVNKQNDSQIILLMTSFTPH